MTKIQTGSHNPRTLPTGSRLKQFIVERTLGTGGFGVTYLARHETLHKMLVAVKEYMPKDEAYRDENGVILLQSESDRADFDFGLNNFFNEAKRLYSLTEESDPSLANIVKVRDVFRHNNTAYMVMDYVEGKSLEIVIKELNETGKRLPEDRLREIFGQLAAAIRLMHSRNLLHLDLTPSNIIVRNQNNKPVLIDFGSARSPAGHTVVADVTRPMAAMHTRIMYTPGYAPLEQCEGLDLDERSDIYGLAATMYHLALRKKPPASMTRRGNVAEKHEDSLVPAVVAGKSAGYSKEFLEALDKGLGLRRHDRPDSIEEWLGSLAILRIQDRHKSPRPAGSGRSTPDWLPRAAIGVAAVLAVALLGWLVSRPSAEELFARGRTIYVAAPFDTSTQADAREYFLNAQLKSDATPKLKAQATIGVEICDLVVAYRNNVRNKQLDEARANLLRVEGLIPSAEFDEKLARTLEADYAYESGLRDLNALLSLTGQGSDFQVRGERLLDQMRTAGQGEPRFEAAESALNNAVRAVQQLEAARFDDALASVETATEASANMGYDAADFRFVKGQIQDARTLYIATSNASAVAAIAEDAAGRSGLARGDELYAQSLRVASGDAAARSGRSLVTQLRAVVADLDSSEADSIVERVQALQPLAQQAGFGEDAWVQVVLAYRGAQQQRRLVQARDVLQQRPVADGTREEVLATLAELQADVREYGLDQNLASQAQDMIKAVAALHLVGIRLGAHDYNGADSQLENSSDTITAVANGDRILATAVADIEKARKAEIEKRWDNAHAVLESWRAPDKTGPLSAPLQRVLSLDPADVRALTGDKLVASLAAMNAAVSKADFEAAASSLNEATELANDIQLDAGFSAENRGWLQAATADAARRKLAAAYLALVVAPTEPDNLQRISDQREAAVRLIQLSTHSIEEANTLEEVTMPLRDIPAALDNGRFREAVSLAERSVSAVSGDLFNAALLQKRLDTIITESRADFDNVVKKTVKKTSNDVHAAVNNAPIDLENLEQSQQLLDSLDSLRSNPEVSYDWTAVDDIDTTLNALAQARNIANSNEFLQASKMLVDTSIALSERTRWRALLLKGVNELEALKQKKIKNLLAEAGELISADPFSSSAWEAGDQRYATVKRIEASDEGLGQLGLEYTSLLRSIAGPVQARDFVWMQSDEGSDLRTASRQFARLPGALRTILAIASDVSREVTAQLEQVQERMDVVFDGLVYEDSETSVFSDKLLLLRSIEEDARSKGLGNILATVDVVKPWLEWMSRALGHLRAQELETAKLLIRKPPEQNGTDILNEQKRQVLSRAEAALRNDITRKAARALINNNKLLTAAFDALAAQPGDAGAIQQANGIVDSVLNDQKDFPDGLVARRLLSELDSASGPNRCSALGGAMETSQEFNYPSFNLGWLEDMHASDCQGAPGG